MSDNDNMTLALAARKTPGAPRRARMWLASPATADIEAPLYPGPWRTRSPLRDACMMATAHKAIPHIDRQDIGAALAAVARTGTLSQSTARTRLLLLTRQPWPVAAVSLRSVLAAAESAGVGVDFHNLAWVASNWENAERHSADMRRWALSFTQPPAPEDQAEEAP